MQIHYCKNKWEVQNKWILNLNCNFTKDIRYTAAFCEFYIIFKFLLLLDLVNMTALVPCIAVSTGFILLTCFLCEALRKIIESTVPDGLLKTALKEAVAGAELCGCGFELIISKSLRIVYCDWTILWFYSLLLRDHNNFWTLHFSCG